MDIIFITNQIKFDILNTGGMPAQYPYNLLANTPLTKVGYNSAERCRLLEQRLHQIALDYNTGRRISAGDVSEELTVRECIKLVIA
ncbi:hypothetical protein FPZ42_15480 [Mucilaginibacter achroorhodeus]|uniref:Uncharacterized protein n=1 Tax=Mucilaginibacter achroorhodeus TaxID=2599294 RepID=A0A563TZE6_9SPHI|nr:MULTISPECIES: hypothetical protein [Mucilaginibacter]QXV65391.1 hypothetical protein INP83_20345 [Mucilaginibacter sp. 21P]TWR24500.1 hypothetical protein FPZ42_15480 [Mucilaginibacter achroorhodeus]